MNLKLQEDKNIIKIHGGKTMISIIIPMYNRATLVGETLDSVFAQTYQDWECLVVDDGSTDNSVEVVQKYVDNDSRFKLLIRPDDRIKGAPTCRNIGWENSNGEIIIFFDSDDVIDSQYFETVVMLMDKHKEAEYGMVPCDKFLITPDKPSCRTQKFIPSKGTLLEQILSYSLSSGTQNMIWRRSLLQRNEMMWREGLLKGQDPDFNIRTIIIAHHGFWLEMPTMVHCRLHDSQMATSARKNHIIGEVLSNNYVTLFCFIRERGRMKEKIRELFLQGILKLTFYFAAIYGNKNGSKIIYDLIQKEAHGFKIAKKLRWKAWLIWKTTPILHLIGGTMFKYRNIPCIRKVISLITQKIQDKGI
jgi:glycosyltransferase involved in cell wall biosynthesis